jgi:uncharacterized protein YndB with AHSA1/START domain
LLQLPLPALFQAISDPSQTSQWWGQKGLYRINNVEADVRPGGTWISRGTGADGKEFSVRGKYLQVDPPRLLVHTWNPSYSNLQETVVRCELEPREVHGLHNSGPAKVGTGTLVRVRHSGFAGNVEQCNSHGEGWTRVLGWMQEFVEQGKTIETR